MKLVYCLLYIVLVMMLGCNTNTAQHQSKIAMAEPLPILSPKINGDYQKIKNFSFTNQYNKPVTQNSVSGKIYVAEFFFTRCPSICPMVAKQLKNVYNTFKDNPNVIILSHTIDPETDTVEKLHDYYTNTLEIDTPSNWLLVTGNKQDIHHIANTSYGTVVYEDDGKNLKDNLMHSGALLLVDTHGLIRGMYDGKDVEHVERLIADIEQLLRETSNAKS